MFISVTNYFTRCHLSTPMVKRLYSWCWEPLSVISAWSLFQCYGRWQIVCLPWSVPWSNIKEKVKFSACSSTDDCLWGTRSRKELRIPLVIYPLLLLRGGQAFCFPLSDSLTQQDWERSRGRVARTVPWTQWLTMTTHDLSQGACTDTAPQDALVAATISFCALSLSPWSHSLPEVNINSVLLWSTRRILEAPVKLRSEERHNSRQK